MQLHRSSTRSQAVLALGVIGITLGTKLFSQQAPSITENAVSTVTAGAVAAHYRTIVWKSYGNALDAVKMLQQRIGEFVESPDESRLLAAREAWIIAHTSYAPTEVYRFYEGPIDNGTSGPEARINGWPMDEVYVDYVVEKPEGGIINDPVRYPWMTTDEIAELNERGGEENIATGFHAIEFLLWGQDMNPDGPGARSWKDYVPGGGAPNPERRAKYLQSIADLLVQDLSRVTREWDLDQAGGYANRFLKDEDRSALAKIFTGIGMMAGDELATERMFVAYDTGDQEDEQSCFSDTTLLALIGNADGIRNVYLGTFADLQGPSLSDLVRQASPAADAAVRDAIAKSHQALSAIPTPLDRVITADSDDPVRQKLLAAIEAMEHEAQTIVAAAAVLGMTLNLKADEGA